MSDQNSLDTILELIEGATKEDAKAAILAWHHQQTTKEMLALIGEDEFEFTSPKREHRNKLKAELRQAIQARKEQ